MGHFFNYWCHFHYATQTVSLPVGALNCALTTDLCHVGKLYFSPRSDPTHTLRSWHRKVQRGHDRTWLMTRCELGLHSTMRKQRFEARVFGFLRLLFVWFLKQPLQLMQLHFASRVNTFLSRPSCPRIGAWQCASHSHLQSILDEDMRVGIDCNFLQRYVPLSCFIRRLIPISYAVGQPTALAAAQDNS